MYGINSPYGQKLIQLRVKLSKFQGKFYIFSQICALGVPSSPKYVVFLNIVQKAVDPPPPLCFEHCGANFF